MESVEGILQNFLANPVQAIIILIVALIVAAILKAGVKVIKWIAIIGIAYVIVNFIGFV